MRRHWMTGLLLGVLSCALSAGEPQAPAAAAPERTFRFSGGERILVQISDAPRSEVWTLEQVVLPDGRISSVRFGSINILGQTLQEAEDEIAAQYKKRSGVQAPLVALTLSAVPVQRVNVQGQVMTPRTVEVPFAGQLTLAAALTEAGGLTDDADLSRIKVLRRLPNNEVVLDSVDGTGIARPGVKYAGPVLLPGDSVVVPRAEAFSVLGEVKRPGVVTRRTSRVPQGVPIRLSHVLAAVGGLNNNAERERISLLRSDENGARNTMAVNASALEKGDTTQDPILHDGDQILVHASEGIMVLGAVMGPGIYYIPVGPPTLSRLVALAGGLQPYAKMNQILLVRKNGRKVSVDLRAVLEKGQTDQDVQLAPGDWVHVPGSPY